MDEQLPCLCDLKKAIKVDDIFSPDIKCPIDYGAAILMLKAIDSSLAIERNKGLIALRFSR